jgi:IMP dehydrogenase
MIITKAYTYDDIQLIPEYSEIESRNLIDLSTQLSRHYKLGIPLVAAPMDTVCEEEMAIALMKLGGVGCIHRFCSIADQVDKIIFINGHVKAHHIFYFDIPIMAAVGTKDDYLERAQELVKNGVNVILIDVAHGHHLNVKNAIRELKKLKCDVIAGNIATGSAAYDLISWGADALRINIGNGALCTTRTKTGFGVPSLTCLWDILDTVGLLAMELQVPIIADGGIRNSGDIAKALAFGASSVMLGSLLAGTEESPGKIVDKLPKGLYKRYRGSASLETKLAHGLDGRNIEGESTEIPYKGGVKYIINDLLDGIRSALSYGGARNLREFRPEYYVVTNSGISEASPHLLK